MALIAEIYPLIVALLLGALIGLERKLHDHIAGLHTHALVSLGSALFILLGIKLSAPTETARVAAQIVMGVGFLGGSVIMRDGLQVRGLNTAVTIWCSCAVGALSGAGLYSLACAGAVLVTVANFVFHYIEHRPGWFRQPAEPKDDKPNPPR